LEEKFIPVWESIQDFVLMDSKKESKSLKRSGILLEKVKAKRLKTSGVSAQEQQESDNQDEIINLQQWAVLVREETSVNITPSVVKDFDQEMTGDTMETVKIGSRQGTLKGTAHEGIKGFEAVPDQDSGPIILPFANFRIEWATLHFFQKCFERCYDRCSIDNDGCSENSVSGRMLKGGLEDSVGVAGCMGRCSMGVGAVAGRGLLDGGLQSEGPKGNWKSNVHLPLTDFLTTTSLSIRALSGCSVLKHLYGRKCRFALLMAEIGEKSADVAYREMSVVDLAGD
ncbi:hypothetical protein Tco_0194106, partial [Tanacetum coccineum]